MGIRDLLERYPYLDEEIKQVTKEIAMSCKMKRDTQDALQPRIMSDMPRSNVKSDPTMMAVLQSIGHHDRHIEYLSKKLGNLYEQKEMVNEALAVLTASEKRSIEMYYFQQMTAAEIAGICKVSRSTVYVNIETGMGKLCKLEESHVKIRACQ